MYRHARLVRTASLHIAQDGLVARSVISWGAGRGEPSADAATLSATATLANAGAVATAAGAEVLMRPEPGLNAALEDGVNRLARDEGEDILFVLGDVAGALAEDFDQLLEEASEETRGIWLAPSSDGGTSALLHRPAGVVPCCFGKDSAKRHREAAAYAQVSYHETPLLSLAIDLDQPEDLEAFLATKGGGRRTRALLTSAGLVPVTNA